LYHTFSNELQSNSSVTQNNTNFKTHSQSQ